MSLEEELEQFDKLLSAHIRKAAKAELRWVTAGAVDWSKKTMTATGVGDEGEYLGVMLGMGSQYKKPKKGTLCLVAVTEWDDTRCILLFCEECELEENNGGDNGGIVNVKELKDNFDSLKSFVEAMHAALPTAFSAIGAGTAAAGSAGGTSYSTAMIGKLINIKDMEDTKITH